MSLDINSVLAETRPSVWEFEHMPEDSRANLSAGGAVEGRVEPGGLGPVPAGGASDREVNRYLSILRMSLVVPSVGGSLTIEQPAEVLITSAGVVAVLHPEPPVRRFKGLSVPHDIITEVHVWKQKRIFGEKEVSCVITTESSDIPEGVIAIMAPKRVLATRPQKVKPSDVGSEIAYNAAQARLEQGNLSEAAQRQLTAATLGRWNNDANGLVLELPSTSR